MTEDAATEAASRSQPFADAALTLARPARGARYARTVRLRHFAIAAATTAVAITLFFACYAAGFIQGGVFALATGLALICVTVFGVVFQTGLNERLSDPSLTLPQVACGVTITAFVMAHAGPARAALSLLLFAILVFATFRFNWRLVLVLASYVLVCHATAIYVASGWEGRALPWRADLMQWAFLAAMAPVLAWMAATQAEQRQRYQAGAALYRAIWNTSVDAVVIFDQTGAVRLANPAALQLFGHEAAVMRNLRVSQLIAPDRRAAMEQDLERYLAGGGANRDWSRFEETGLTAAGRELFVDAAVIELGGHGGQRDLFEGGGRRLALFARDVSQRRALEAIKDDFIATMSHELRTPLAAVIGAVEALQHSPAAAVEERGSLMTMAAQGADRLNSLINTMLHLQKMDAGGIEFAPVAVPAARLIERAFASQELAVQRAGCHLAVARRTGDARVRADERWIHEVLINLIDNAVKHSPAAATVVLEAEVRERGVRFLVIDQGSGVPPDFAGRVFSRFGRASAPDTRARGGAGLGLSLCKAAVEGCGGTIGYQNNPLKGATFWFELPRADL